MVSLRPRIKRFGLARFLVISVAGLSCALCTGTGWAQGGRDLKTVNVCKAVPGDAIATAVGGRLAEVRPFTPKDPTFTRCTYFVDVPGTGQATREAYSLWFYPPADFEDLRKYTNEKITEVSGLADGAYEFRDSGDGRFKIRVLKRGDVSFEATAGTADAARKVAGVAVAWLAKKR
jgi:hypothetical protein